MNYAVHIVVALGREKVPGGMSRVCISCLFWRGRADKSLLLLFHLFGSVCKMSTCRTFENLNVLRKTEFAVLSHQTRWVLTADCDWKSLESQNVPWLSTSLAVQHLLQRLGRSTLVPWERHNNRQVRKWGGLVVFVWDSGATSTIHALQTAASFRRTLKSKVISQSLCAACTHYAPPSIDPLFICRMRTAFCVCTAGQSKRLALFYFVCVF